MTYDSAISKQGSLVHTIEGVEAPDALAAINKVEKEFRQKNIRSRGLRTLLLLEFEARRLDFSLS